MLPKDAFEEFGQAGVVPAVNTVRMGQDPVAALKECAPRLLDFHMKDVTEATAKGGSVEVGKGVIDIKGVLKVLLDVKFPYHVALEYEAKADALEKKGLLVKKTCKSLLGNSLVIVARLQLAF